MWDRKIPSPLCTRDKSRPGSLGGFVQLGLAVRGQGETPCINAKGAKRAELGGSAGYEDILVNFMSGKHSSEGKVVIFWSGFPKWEFTGWVERVASRDDRATQIMILFSSAQQQVSPRDDNSWRTTVSGDDNFC